MLVYGLNSPCIFKEKNRLSNVSYFHLSLKKSNIKVENFSQHTLNFIIQKNPSDITKNKAKIILQIFKLKNVKK